ncbi:hypothetical protein BpHYR1_021992 [Brachionus plicatilis]|uniref:Uncharacterized protein n=1 Tax=Brachionus plicatilis TaxID=10195 RepID=A0A3M7RF09_BRAPC|nr:hypothetical protein BpHYR1_021992 [Brachionus plicatilis]
MEISIISSGDSKTDELVEQPLAKKCRFENNKKKDENEVFVGYYDIEAIINDDHFLHDYNWNKRSKQIQHLEYNIYIVRRGNSQHLARDESKNILVWKQMGKL